MVMGLFVDARALALVSKDLQDFARDVAGSNRLRQAWERVRDEVMIPSIDDNFVVGGRPTQWEPIAEATFLRRKRGGGGGRAGYVERGLAGTLDPLIDTGQLHRAAIAKARWHIAQNQMTYGNFPPTRWFGPVHDYGSPSAGIPQRQFAMFQQPSDTDAIGEILMEWVEDLVNKNVRLKYP